jgi:hypothetical protein
LPCEGDGVEAWTVWGFSDGEEEAGGGGLERDEVAVGALEALVGIEGETVGEGVGGECGSWEVRGGGEQGACGGVAGGVAADAGFGEGEGFGSADAFCRGE